jgi:hypothetical protein
MLPEEIEQISGLVNELEKIDVTERIKNEIKHIDGSVETTKIGSIDAVTFIETFELVKGGLKKILNSNIRLFLPKSFGKPDAVFSPLIFLTEEIDLLNNSIQRNYFNGALPHLNNVITYLLIYNLLPENGERLKDKEKIDKLGKIYSEIDLKRRLLDDAIKDKNTLLTDIEKTVAEQNKIIEGLQDELKEANRKNEAINELLLQSTANEQKIVNLTGNFEHEFERLEKLNNIKQKELAGLKNNYEESLNAIKAFEDSTFDIANRVQEKSTDFDSQLAKLNELLGMQAAASLFSTFKTRKEELSKPVTRWMQITFGAGGFALLWVIAVFTNFFGLVGNQEIEIDSTFLILNSLKSVPAIILLYFSIRQYVRERNMQEEYAFRSAIALTIQAYGDMVGDKKHELIMAATATIYTMPTVMKERSFSLFRKKDNGMIEVMKQLNETLKTVQSNK